MAIEKISSTVSKPKSGKDVKTVQGMMRHALMPTFGINSGTCTPNLRFFGNSTICQR